MVEVHFFQNGLHLLLKTVGEKEDFDLLDFFHYDNVAVKEANLLPTAGEVVLLIEEAFQGVELSVAVQEVLKEL